MTDRARDLKRRLGLIELHLAGRRLISPERRERLERLADGIASELDRRTGFPDGHHQPDRSDYHPPKP